MNSASKNKLLTLRSIEHTSLFLQQNDPFKMWIATPVNMVTLLIGLSVMMAFSLILSMLYQTFEMPRLPFFPTIMGLMAAVSFKVFSKMPKTLLGHLDNLLTKYEPEDRVAFQAFKSKCAKTGQIDVSDLAEWISQERSAIQSDTRNPLKFTKND